MTVTKTKEITTIQRKARGLVSNAQALVVDDEESASNANELLVFVANAKKELEAQRVFLVKPLNDHVKDINAKFKEWVAPLDEADSVVRRKMLDFQREQEVLRVQEQEALRVEAQRLEHSSPDVLAPEPEEMPDLPVVSRTVATQGGSTSVRKTWVYEMIDEAAVPREYLIIDEGVITLAIRDGVREIPGIRIYQKESLAVRSK